MSMYLTAAAFKLKVGNPLRKLVLLKLADNSNEDGECFPSYQRIADDCEISRSSVINHIAWLEKAGIISKHERFNSVTNSSNIYKMNFEFAGKDVALVLPNGEVIVLKNGDLKSIDGVVDILGGVGDTPTSVGAVLGGGVGDTPIINNTINQSINHIHNTSSDDDASSAIKTKKIRSTKPKAPVTDIYDAYNEVLGDKLPKALILTDARKRDIAARWNELLNTEHKGKLRYSGVEDGLHWWKRLFAKVTLNPHWVGDNDRGWRADLDWIINKKNFVKVLEYIPNNKK